MFKEITQIKLNQILKLKCRDTFVWAIRYVMGTESKTGMLPAYIQIRPPNEKPKWTETRFIELQDNIEPIEKHRINIYPGSRWNNGFILAPSSQDRQQETEQMGSLFSFPIRSLFRLH